MPRPDREEALRHIRAVLKKVNEEAYEADYRFRNANQGKPLALQPRSAWSFVPASTRSMLNAAMHSAIQRYTVDGSVLHDRLNRALAVPDWDGVDILPQLRGILQALELEVENGWWERAETLIRGDLMEDFLVRAEYLLDQGFTHEALTNARIVLEGHLRLMAKANQIVLRRPDGQWNKAAWLNDQLQARQAYGGSATQHKLVSAWLAEGNDATHPAPKQDEESARRAIEGIRDFINRFAV